jgi:hypothetical protein
MKLSMFYALCRSSQRLFAFAALTGSLLAGLPAVTWADGNAGLTIFSGVDRKDVLDYHLDFGGNPNQSGERYKLYIPSKKLTQGASKFFITYPENFDGKFDPDRIEVRVKGQAVPIKEAIWDKESRLLEIDLVKPIEAATKVDLVLSNVKNPDFGTYYIRADVQASGQIPLRLYVGTWIVTINR